MSLITNCTSILRQRTSCLTIFRTYSKPNVPAAMKKKKGGKLGPIVEKVTIPVETDANKLVNYVCGSNIMKTGEDIKIKDDSEYPEWLWTIHTGKAPTLDELDPETKQYWRKLRKLALQRNNMLSKNQDSVISIGEYSANYLPQLGLKDSEALRYFAEVRQLLDLLILEEWSTDLHDYGKSENRYNLLQPSTIIIVLEKVREADKETMFSVLKKSERDKKKLWETVLKQLKQLAERQN